MILNFKEEIFFERFWKYLFLLIENIKQFIAVSTSNEAQVISVHGKASHSTLITTVSKRETTPRVWLRDTQDTAGFCPKYFPKMLAVLKSQKMSKYTNTRSHLATTTKQKKSAKYPTTKQTWPKEAKFCKCPAVTTPRAMRGIWDRFGTAGLILCSVFQTYMYCFAPRLERLAALSSACKMQTDGNFTSDLASQLLFGKISLNMRPSSPSLIHLGQAISVLSDIDGRFMQVTQSTAAVFWLSVTHWWIYPLKNSSIFHELSCEGLVHLSSTARGKGPCPVCLFLWKHFTSVSSPCCCGFCW